MTNLSLIYDAMSQNLRSDLLFFDFDMRSFLLTYYMSIPSVIVIEREIFCPRLSRERGLWVSSKAGEALPASGREVELMVSELSSPYPILGLPPALIKPYLPIPLRYAKLAKGLSEEMGVEELVYL